MWPFTKKPEKRESGGDFSDSVLRLIEAQAAGSAADASSTAAVEAAAGALSRAFASAEVQGPAWIQNTITPEFLGQVGRDLIRAGDSMHVVKITSKGKVILLPCSSWHFEGEADPDSWTIRATVYGPSTSTTRNLPFEAVVFVKWGSSPGQPYVGTGPLSWAHTTARLQSETERSLADEAAGPLAQILAVPQDGGDDDDNNPLKMIKADIAKARGKALLVETTAAGWAEGKSAAPQSDWKQQRLGPMMPESMATIRTDSFNAVLAACGTPPSLFDDSDGTAQRESFRRYLTLTVQPIAKILERELSAKLEADVSLNFDGLYAHDLQGRATSFQKLVAGGVPVNEALITSGLLVNTD